MEILSNSTTTNHGEVFVSLCRKADEIVMVSPFCYSDFTDFADTIASFSDIHRVVFVTSLKTEEVVRKIDALISFRNEMKRINVQWELRADNHLHGKIYIFKNSGQPFAGIITSANLTNNGMVANHEWGCLIEDEKLLKGIEQQVLSDVRHNAGAHREHDFLKQREVIESLKWSETIEILHEFEVVTMDLAKSIDPLMKVGLRRLDSVFNG